MSRAPRQTDLYDFLPGGEFHRHPAAHHIKAMEKLESMDGATFDKAKDGVRLNQQLERVRAVMEGGEWRTLVEIARLAECPEASASARLRDLRKPRFGGFIVERRRRGNGGTWEYRVAKEA